MRCATGLLLLLIASGLVGCRSQSTPLTNPFLTPDRVPPPSTRVLPPGAAQPYYPGDSPPGGAAAAPTASYPAAGAYAPPASAVPPATFPAIPITPTPTPSAGSVSPPSGWPTYPPQAGGGGSSAQLVATTGDAVSVPADGQRLRFETPSAAPLAASSPTLAAAPTTGAFLPGVTQAAYNEPVSGNGSPFERLQASGVALDRAAGESAPVVGLAAPTGAPAAIGGSDGFRPQSAAPRPEPAPTGAVAKGFRSPSLGSGSPAGSKHSPERFAVGPAQEWLRGQLEYWPENGEWSLRYMPEGQVDQIGGRILIDNPQVLANLSPGEFVMVEGQVFGRQLDDEFYRPVYRVSVVQRQRE